LKSRELQTLDALRVPEARSDELGRVRFAPIEPGSYELVVSSDWYRKATLALAIDGSARTPPPIPLERLQLAVVELIGGRPAELAEYQVSRLGHSLHAHVEPDWTSVLPWPEGTEPTLTVHGPESLEIVALFAGVDATTETLSVRVGDGESLEVTVVGEHGESAPLVLASGSRLRSVTRHSSRSSSRPARTSASTSASPATSGSTSAYSAPIARSSPSDGPARRSCAGNPAPPSSTSGARARTRTSRVPREIVSSRASCI